jgi:hypothetical protein
MFWEVQKRSYDGSILCFIHCEVYLFWSEVLDEGTASIFKVIAFSLAG